MSFTLCRCDNDVEVCWRKLLLLWSVSTDSPVFLCGDPHENWDKAAVCGSEAESGTSRIQTKLRITQPPITFYSLIKVWETGWLLRLLLRHQVFWYMLCTPLQDDCLRWKESFPNVSLSLDLCCFLVLENKQEKDKEMKNEIRNEKK
jgi:hypothetical protein